MKQKLPAESYMTQVPHHEGHSDATHHMRDVAGPPADPKGTALSTAEQNAQ